MILDDTVLISRVLAYDDHYAFSQLVKKYQSSVRLFLRRMLKNNCEVADDLAQETFILAYKKLQSFERKSSFATWLYAISKNLFLQYVRKTKNQFSWEEKDSAGISTDISGDVFVGISKQNTGLRMDLEEAMQSLRPIERAAVTLCYCQELTHKEVAELLDIPIGTLKTHVNRGRQNLQIFLSEYKKGGQNGST